MTTFDKAWTAADAVPGWLTRAQGHALWQAARTLPAESTVVEIGSHQGRSTLVLAAALPPRSRVVAVDPFVDGRLFGGVSTRGLFERNIADHGLAGVVHLEARYSHELLAESDHPIHLLYVDGKHDYWSCTRDLAWSGHLPAGSTVLVHDAFSSVGVTAAVLGQAASRRSALRYRRRIGSLAEFEVARPSGADRLRVLRELPWFIRNLTLKILLRLRLRGVARLAGHDSPYDPY